MDRIDKEGKDGEVSEVPFFEHGEVFAVTAMISEEGETPKARADSHTVSRYLLAEMPRSTFFKSSSENPPGSFSMV